MSNGLKTSLGIWAFGPMVTRFVPGGYKPEYAGETTADRVRRAVDGLGDLIDGYEFHYPQDQGERRRDKAALEARVYCMARAAPRPELSRRRVIPEEVPAPRASAGRAPDRLLRRARRALHHLRGSRVQLSVQSPYRSAGMVARDRQAASAVPTADSLFSSTRTPSRPEILIAISAERT